MDVQQNSSGTWVEQEEQKQTLQDGDGDGDGEEPREELSGSDSDNSFTDDDLDMDSNARDLSMESSLEEEIALNETMLESLQKRMMTLDESILQETKSRQQHQDNIENLQRRHDSLVKTRKVNSDAVRVVTQTLDKCIQRLKKALSERGKGKGVKTDDDNSQEDMIDMDTSRSMGSEGYGNSDNDAADSERDSLTSIQGTGVEAEVDDATVEVPATETIRQLHIRIPPIDEKRKTIQSVSTSLTSTNPTRYRWLRNDNPTTTLVFDESDLSTNHCHILPLHSPFASQSILKQVVDISQKEVLARRRGMDGLQLEKDYVLSVQNTVLDFAACSQYDPHLLPMQRMHPRHCHLKSQKSCSLALSQNNDEEVTNITADEQQESEESLQIDANTIICRKALFGKCDDPQCEYQHLSGRANLKVGNIFHGNKIRTVAVEGRKERRITVVLPVESHPLPPFPGSGLAESNLKRTLPSSTEEASDMKSRIKRQKVNDKFEQVEADVRDISTDTAVKCDDSVVSCVSTSGKLIDDEQMQNESSSAENKDENAVFDSEEDFIWLPTIDEGGAQISAAIDMVLSDSESEDTISEDDDPAISHDLLQDPSHFLRPLSMALSFSGFDISQLENDGSEQEPKSHLRYTPDEPSSDMDSNDIIGQIMLETKLLCSAIEALNLCIHAGRVDICNAILHYCETVLDSEDLKARKGRVVMDHLTCMQQALEVMSDFVESSFYGSSPFNPSSTLHIHLLLTSLCHLVSYYHLMLKSRHQEYYKTCDAEIQTTILNTGLTDDIRHFREEFDVFLEFAHFGKDCKMDPKETTKRLIHNSFTSLLSEFESLTPLQSDTSIDRSSSNLINYLTLGQDLASGVAKESNVLGDPQLIIESVLFNIVNILKLYSAKCRFSLEDESNTCIGKGSTSQLQIFLLFAPAIFTTISAVQALINSDRDDQEIALHVPFSTRQQGILVQMKQLVMQCIHHLDFSGLIKDNMEGQLLLCPFFSSLSTLLVISGSYTKAHVLLVNALYSAHTKLNWAIYSDLLWSQLIQLHMSFPLSGETGGNSKLHIDDSLERLQTELVSKPHSFGVYPSKIVLEGDAIFANHDSLNSSKIQGFQKTSDDGNYIGSIHAFCSRISRLQRSGQYCQTTKIDIQRPSVSCPLRVFPMSFCLIGKHILSLSLNNLDLEALPLVFGRVFRNIQVSISR